jgi:hypothetical protein
MRRVGFGPEATPPIGFVVLIVAFEPHYAAVAFEGDSRAVWFEGNYADYLADRRKRLGTDADQPHRVRYRPLAA